MAAPGIAAYMAAWVRFLRVAIDVGIDDCATTGFTWLAISAGFQYVAEDFAPGFKCASRNRPGSGLDVAVH